MKKKNIHAVRLGRLGGKAGTGKAKARTSDQARRASLARFKNKAFTLIELLVVIGIIALLLGIIIPSYNNIMEKAKVTKAKAEVKNLETAFKGYLDIYRVWPSDWSDGPINGVIFTALRQNPTDPDTDNPQRIPFYEFTSFTNTSMDQTTAWDVWSTPSDPTTWQTYRVMFDKNYNNQIDALSDVYRSVIVYSVGKNRQDEQGGGDDIASWK